MSRPLKASKVLSDSVLLSFEVSDAVTWLAAYDLVGVTSCAIGVMRNARAQSAVN